MLGVAGSSNVWLLVLAVMVFRLVVDVREVLCNSHCKGKTEVLVTCGRTLLDVDNWIVDPEIVNKPVEACSGCALKAVKCGQSGHCCPQHGRFCQPFDHSGRKELEHPLHYESMALLIQKVREVRTHG